MSNINGAGMLNALMLQQSNRPKPGEEYTVRSHISSLYSPELIKKLFANALLIDIEDNNEKVDIIKELLGEKFIELGPGTNRYGCVGPDGYCHKIAMDRRGIVDNITEYKRSPELDWVSPKVYETNGPILIAENVELLTKENFRRNREGILQICAALAENYIFTDIGYAMKNFCNWGINKKGDLVVLDTGYIIPIVGNEEALICPVCGGNRKLHYNRNFTGFVCGHCNTDFQFIDVYRRLTNKYDDDSFVEMTGFELPDFNQLNNALYNNTLMKGGHIRSDIGSVTYDSMRGGKMLYAAGANQETDADGHPRSGEEARGRSAGDILPFEDILDILRAQEDAARDAHGGDDGAKPFIN